MGPADHDGGDPPPGRVDVERGSLTDGASRPTVRWIPPMTMGGAWHMAIDAWLLDQASTASQSPPRCVVRLYQWSRPTISLGFHQRRIPEHWWRMVRAGEIDMVRRPSGGRAVLHAGDLTYALIWPGAPLRREEAYRQACGWLQEAFVGMGLPLSFGHHRGSAERSSCFATSTTADLVHPDGAKRIGSAQLWRRGHLLQHGSIQIEPPAHLWRKVFGQDTPSLPPLPVATDALLEQLRRAAWGHFPPSHGDAGQRRATGECWREIPLNPVELAAIASCLGRFRIGRESEKTLASRPPRTVQEPDRVPSEAEAAGGETSPERTMPSTN